MKKIQVTLTGTVDLEDDEDIVHFTVKVLRGGGPGPLREVKMTVPEYTTEVLEP